MSISITIHFLNYIFSFDQSRVVQLANGERSYHIFYQLCAGAPSTLRDRLNLKMAGEYKYLNQSECLVISGVDDGMKFHKLEEALDIVQIRKEDQEQAFAMLAAVLWLGNISFQVVDNENHVEALADEAVNSAARLINCSAQDLILALSTHKIQAGKDSY
uniref:Myosin motor domain-containing protein n=1 Tax=Salix viminalis TaxID=40686 RepID=A0A6N2MHW8_SALVM